MPYKASVMPVYSQQPWIELRQQVVKRGLLERQYGFYFVKFWMHVICLLLSLVYLWGVPSFWWQIPNIFFLAFCIVQMIGLGHDAGHHSIFTTAKYNNWLGVVILGLFGGSSFTWWQDKHNEHHSHPNEEDEDPDIDFPVVAFSPEQALQKKEPWKRWFVSHQAVLFPFLVTLIPLNMRVHSVIKILKGESRYGAAELSLMILHFGILFYISYQSLGLWQAIIFNILLQMLGGLYLSSVFAPNHKGMPILAKGSVLPFYVRQIITARNVMAHPLTDFVYLGLNYQVEHHLFPNMPRNKMYFANAMVRNFCKKHQISYHETSIIDSFKEIYHSLNDVSKTYERAAAGLPTTID